MRESRRLFKSTTESIPMAKGDDDRFWRWLVSKVGFNRLTAETLEKELDSVDEKPLSDAEIDCLVESVVEQTKKRNG